jgi:hypothetical protein
LHVVTAFTHAFTLSSKPLLVKGSSAARDCIGPARKVGFLHTPHTRKRMRMNDTSRILYVMNIFVMHKNVWRRQCQGYVRLNGPNLWPDKRSRACSSSIHTRSIISGCLQMGRSLLHRLSTQSFTATTTGTARCTHIGVLSDCCAASPST